jgi:hypothetical protein
MVTWRQVGTSLVLALLTACAAPPSPTRTPTPLPLPTATPTSLPLPTTMPTPPPAATTLPTPTPSPSAPAPASPKPVDEQTAVLDAYRAAWAAFETASRDPVDPNHPLIARSITGRAQINLRNALQRLVEQRHYFDGPPIDLQPRVSELAEARAVVEDCVVDLGAEYAAGGALVRAADGTPVAYRAVVVKMDGSWRLSELEQLERCTRS